MKTFLNCKPEKKGIALINLQCDEQIFSVRFLTRCHNSNCPYIATVSWSPDPRHMTPQSQQHTYFVFLCLSNRSRPFTSRLTFRHNSNGLSNKSECLIYKILHVCGNKQSSSRFCITVKFPDNFGIVKATNSNDYFMKIVCIYTLLYRVSKMSQIPPLNFFSFKNIQMSCNISSLYGIKYLL